MKGTWLISKRQGEIRIESRYKARVAYTRVSLNMSDMFYPAFFSKSWSVLMPISDYDCFYVTT